MNVIIQTSSAAVLAIPGLFIAAGARVPTFSEAWPIYLGTVAFAFAFAFACLEQVLSAKAYFAQRLVVQEYYAKKSDKTCDNRAVGRADLARNASLAIFAMAVSLGGLGLVQFARGLDVKAASKTDNASIPASSTSPAGTNAAASTPATAANAG